jgi:hypothetical protein
MLRGQPPADLEQIRADTAADPPGESGRVMPPVGGLLAALGAAGGPDGMPASPAGRCRAEPELSDDLVAPRARC